MPSFIPPVGGVGIIGIWKHAGITGHRLISGPLPKMISVRRRLLSYCESISRRQKGIRILEGPRLLPAASGYRKLSVTSWCWRPFMKAKALPSVSLMKKSKCGQTGGPTEGLFICRKELPPLPPPTSFCAKVFSNRKKGGYLKYRQRFEIPGTG